MNALQVHNYTQSVLTRLYRLQISNEAKTAKHLQVVDQQIETSNQKIIEQAVDNAQLGNHTKGVIIDVMA